MINVLSYFGMNVHSEVCLWTLLGLIRTIFDATLFRVNSNLKQVWQMSMPDELSMPVQRVLRTMISGVMLVQCFTVYVYLASYIVLLYPVFLEERPNLILPWLLLAAIRKFLCELTSLALGLGTCVLLGPARPPCIKFVIIKLISIMPAFYMWMLLYSYYHTLKVATAFKTFPAVLPQGDRDYGLELAIRRRRTKSLLGEEQLRSKIVASLYGERNSINGVTKTLSKIGISSRMMHSTDTSALDLVHAEEEAIRPMSVTSNQLSDTGSYEDWFGSEVVLPRSCDRILEQFVLMLLRIGAYMDKERVQPVNLQIFSVNKPSHTALIQKCDNLNCPSMSTDNPDTPIQVGSRKPSHTASYLQEYPQIFMKKSVDIARSDKITDDNGITIRTRKHIHSVSSNEKISIDVEKIVSRRKYMPDIKNHDVSSQHNNSMSVHQSTSQQMPHSSKDKKFNSTSTVKKQSSCSINQLKEAIDAPQSEERIGAICEKQSIHTNKSSHTFKKNVLLEGPSASTNNNYVKKDDNKEK